MVVYKILSLLSKYIFFTRANWMNAVMYNIIAIEMLHLISYYSCLQYISTINNTRKKNILVQDIGCFLIGSVHIFHKPPKLNPPILLRMNSSNTPYPYTV